MKPSDRKQRNPKTERPASLLDISAQANNAQDRGLLEIALHSDFQNNGYTRLLYTYAPPEVFCNVVHANAEPDGSGNRVGRLMRLTADSLIHIFGSLG